MDLTDGQLREFLDEVKRDDFAAVLNTKFRVNQEFEAELITVSDAKILPHQESFSMSFLMPGDFPLLQGNYTFEHPQMGLSEIFVVPVESTADGNIFQAVFNRLLPKT